MTGESEAPPPGRPALGPVDAGRARPALTGEGVVPLQLDRGRAVTRVGDTVRRPTGWWTPAVHALLRHLETAGFAQAPRVLGVDQQGREVLAYIPGAAGRDAWSRVVPEDGLRAFARLLRRYHEAVRTFRPPPGALWACAAGSPGPGEVVCHGDFGPWNVVWEGGRPVGLLDWDMAGPGPARYDVAYALEYAAPFRDDATCTRWLAYPEPPDRRRRVAVFCEAYGLGSAAGLVDEVLRVQRSGIDQVRLLAARGLQPQAAWVAEGHLEELAARVAWTRAHRRLFE